MRKSKYRVCAVLGFTFVSFTAPAYAQISDDIIKIGVLTDMTGITKDVSGPRSVVAAQMAIAEFGGQINGKRIELVSADTQNKPDIAAGIAREWYDQQKVDMIVDLPISAVALAVQAISRDRKKISIINGGNADITGQYCSPNSFQWTWDTYSISYGLGQALTRAGEKTWFFIFGNYAAAESIVRITTAAVEANGGKVLGSVRTPYPNPDFASALLTAQQSKAQVVALANGGQDMSNAVKQAEEFGLKKTQRIAGTSVNMSDIVGLGLEASAGMQYITGFLHNQSAEALDWSQKFATLTGGSIPSQNHAGVYSAVRHYLQAIKEIGTDDTNAVVARMRATPVNDVMARNGRIRADGRMVHDQLLVEVKQPSESKDPWDLVRIISVVPADVAFRPLSDGGCPLVKN